MWVLLTLWHPLVCSTLTPVRCVPIQLSHTLLSMRRSMGWGGGSRTLLCAFLPGAGSQEQHP